MVQRIITFAADKGGVGKTTLAYEIAFTLGAILVDLDWSGGGATSLWGFDPRARRRAPLLDALESRRRPTPYLEAGRPDLVPSHPDWGASDIDPDVLAGELRRWTEEWGRPVVIDTHPGFGDKTLGAVRAADVVAIPVAFRSRELDALEEMVNELRGFHVVICPNVVPPIPPLPMLQRMKAIVGTNGVVVGPPISEHRWWARRQLRAALTSLPEPGRHANRAATELRTLANFLDGHRT